MGKKVIKLINQKCIHLLLSGEVSEGVAILRVCQDEGDVSNHCQKNSNWDLQDFKVVD